MRRDESKTPVISQKSQKSVISHSITPKASAVIKGLRPLLMHIRQTDYICALTRFLVPTLSANGFDLIVRKTRQRMCGATPAHYCS